MPTHSMSTYPVADLLHLWEREKLTADQAIGHLLQHLHDLAQRLAEAERRLEQVTDLKP